MPCRDYGYENAYAEQQVKRLDEATQVACEVLRHMVECHPSEMILLSPETLVWWKKHQEQDRRRMAAEQKAREEAEAKARALAKLSPQDRKLLGLR